MGGMTRDMLPKGWSMSRVGEVARITMGQSPPGTATNDRGEGMPLLGGASDLPAGSSPRVSRFTVRPTKTCAPGDVLLCIRATIGRPTVSDGHYCLGRGLAALRPLAVERQWLVYFLRQAEAALAEAGSGSTFVSVSRERLAALPIPVPPLAEQRRIVAKLDELLAGSRTARAALEAVPALLEQYRQAVLAAAFTGELTADWRQQYPHLAPEWRALPWREVGSCQNGRAFPSKEYSTDGVRLLRPGNLHVSGRVEWTTENTRHMPLTWAERFPTHIVGPGELVMNLTAQSLKDEFLGRVCMTGPDERCLLNQRIARLTAKTVDTRFAFWAFKSPLFRRYVDRLNTGSLIQHIFTSQIDDFVMPVPSAEEQREIVRRVEALLVRYEHLAELLTSVEGQLAPFETSLLAKAFRGELVPRDPSDEPASALLDRIRAERMEAPARRSRRRAARA